MLTAWIPLQDVDGSMGTLTMIDRSHRWERTAIVEAIQLGDTFLGADPTAVEAQLEASGMRIEPVPMILECGQVSFHNCLTLHGSGPNRSDQPRIAVTMHYQDRENRHRRTVDDQGNVRSHSNDFLCRRLPGGEPDYSDPTVCPVAWEGAVR
jgi:ectoine hydroxylase-related dioxygenase (phytanoyl-CoA dioxygenase family)